MLIGEKIRKTREYLDYIEEHVENVRKAFIEFSEKCNGLHIIGDDYSWFTLKEEVLSHDISKMSCEEFVQYRESFYPVSDTEKAEANMGEAWNHHKESNSHHWESLSGYIDVAHMVIDWMAMGYKFGDTAQEYYENNKDRIEISDDNLKSMFEMFDKLYGEKG